MFTTSEKEWSLRLYAFIRNPQKGERRLAGDTIEAESYPSDLGMYGLVRHQQKIHIQQKRGEGPELRRREMKAILAVILLLLVGCSGMVQAQEEETDPQIEALAQRVAALEAESALQRERISKLEPTPLVQRMKRQAIAQELVAESTAIASLVAPPNASGGYFDWLVKQVQLYGPSYAAWRCLEGVEPTVADFRDVVTATYANGVGPGGAAQWVTQLMDNEIKRRNSSNEEPRLCLRSYLHCPLGSETAFSLLLFDRLRVGSMRLTGSNPS